jgi:hypothetical protein
MGFNHVKPVANFIHSPQAIIHAYIFVAVSIRVEAVLQTNHNINDKPYGLDALYDTT